MVVSVVILADSICRCGHRLNDYSIHRQFVWICLSIRLFRYHHFVSFNLLFKNCSLLHLLFLLCYIDTTPTFCLLSASLFNVYLLLRYIFIFSKKKEKEKKTAEKRPSLRHSVTFVLMYIMYHVTRVRCLLPTFWLGLLSSRQGFFICLHEADLGLTGRFCFQFSFDFQYNELCLTLRNVRRKRLGRKLWYVHETSL